MKQAALCPNLSGTFLTMVRWALLSLAVQAFLVRGSRGRLLRDYDLCWCRTLCSGFGSFADVGVLRLAR